MRLCKLSEYRRLFFTPQSAPTLRTLRRNIKKIPGGTVRDGHYYVDLDMHANGSDLSASLRERQAELEKSLELQGLV
jgi:hypothetical protein